MDFLTENWAIISLIIVAAGEGALAYVRNQQGKDSSYIPVIRHIINFVKSTRKRRK